MIFVDSASWARLRIDHVDPRRAKSGNDHRVSALEERMARERRQRRRAGIPAEVVKIVAFVRHHHRMDDLAMRDDSDRCGRRRDHRSAKSPGSAGACTHRLRALPPSPVSQWRERLDRDERPWLNLPFVDFWCPLLGRASNFWCTSVRTRIGSERRAKPATWLLATQKNAKPKWHKFQPV
jgi:hypothetical protein